MQEIINKFKNGTTRTKKTKKYLVNDKLLTIKEIANKYNINYSTLIGYKNRYKNLLLQEIVEKLTTK
jgi:DNA-binding transcriptional regulator YhcF (GntR family)